MNRPSKKIDDLSKIEWDFYQNQRTYLRQFKHEQENKFSQNIIYLAAWTFSLLATFSQLFKEMQYKYLLVGALALSWLSLLLILTSFYLSIKSSKKFIKQWDESRKDLDENDCLLCSIRVVTLTSFIFLILSLIMIFVFYTINFIYMSDNQKVQWVEKVEFQKNSEAVSAWIPPSQFFQWQQWIQTWPKK